jgi:formamidopyrimidine-DNA glycosylase
VAVTFKHLNEPRLWRFQHHLAASEPKVEKSRMPELPEVETMRRGILGITGARIEDAVRLRCRLKPLRIYPRIDLFRRRAVDRSIEQVGRVGKRVILLLDSGDRIIFEPRMTGLVLLADPPSPEHLRFRFDLSGSISHVWYWDRRGLGNVRLLSPDEFHEQLGPHKVGTDALELKPGEMRDRLCGSRRAVKVALLDQQAIAGIGNLYASEILHQARVHPEKSCDRVGSEEWERILVATLEILETAIRCEGSTLSDGTYRNALNQSGSYQNQHRVYDRAGQSCLVCRTGKVERIVQAQRATFYCSICQPKRHPRKRK